MKSQISRVYLACSNIDKSLERSRTLRGCISLSFDYIRLCPRRKISLQIEHFKLLFSNFQKFI